MAFKHKEAYLALSEKDRLACLEISPGCFHYLCRSVKDRYQRESVIPQEDIDGVVRQIIALPFLGGRKGALKLVEDRQALVGETVYKEIKCQVAEEAEAEIFRRRQESELRRNQYKRQEDRSAPFQPLRVQSCHEVWAIDFTFIKLVGMELCLCVVYELYSQAYLALVAGETADNNLAIEALEKARQYAKQTPTRCLLSDNGSQFLSYEFQTLLTHLKMKSMTIPPGQPWYNGSLETGNKDLKKVIHTVALYGAAETPQITRVGASREEVLGYLSLCCEKAQKLINEQIPRVKNQTTPMAVLKNLRSQKAEMRKQFIQKKKTQRTQRMQAIKAGTEKVKHKTIHEKVHAVWNQIKKTMNFETLFAFNELIHQRHYAITT